MKKGLFNIRSISFYALLLLSLTVACKKSDSDSNPAISPNSEINKWVLDSMRMYYYWSSELPGQPNLNQEPEAFFASIKNTNDRFSWIQPKEELIKNLNGIYKTAGIDIYLLRESESSNNVIGLIKYVVPNSPASKQNLVRGQLFTKVNGTKITVSNYQTVISPMFENNPFTLTTATAANGSLTETATLTLTPVEMQEDPIPVTSVYTTPNGTKVGYLYYSQFLDEYDDKLVQSFASFKAAGVSQLVLDLRYNPGGSISSAALITALIQKGFLEENIFVQFQGNKYMGKNNFRYSDIFNSSAFPTIKSANLNLPTVYVLATEYSASASELVINNLRPFINVVHIGDVTVGKNQASRTIYDQRKPERITWAIQPIMFKLANKDGFGDYESGLSPQYAVNELDQPLYPLGDTRDPLFIKALSLIDGGMTTSAKSVESKSGGLKFGQSLPLEKKIIPVILNDGEKKNL